MGEIVFPVTNWDDHLTKGLYALSVLALINIAGDLSTTALHYLVEVTVKAIQLMLPLDFLFKLAVVIVALKLGIKIVKILTVPEQQWNDSARGYDGRVGDKSRRHSDEGAPCLVCKVRSRSVGLLPCGHLCICRPCSWNYKSFGSKCPKCRARVQCTYSHHSEKEVPTKKSSSEQFSHTGNPVTTKDKREPCVVCQDRPKSVMIVPCRHLCLCKECCRELVSRGAPCPLCRSHIHHSLQVYT